MGKVTLMSYPALGHSDVLCLQEKSEYLLLVFSFFFFSFFFCTGL